VTEEIFLLNSADNAEGKGARSCVLDLHANAEVEGSRFENPLWFKYLPSLKPIGLSAMLTHCPTPPHASGSAFSTLEDISTQNRSRAVSGHGHGHGGHGHGHGHGGHGHGLGHRHSSRKKNPMEMSLVRHVRRSIPFQTLKDLAEEIGSPRINTIRTP